MCRLNWTAKVSAFSTSQVSDVKQIGESWEALSAECQLKSSRAAGFGPIIHKATKTSLVHLRIEIIVGALLQGM